MVGTCNKYHLSRRNAPVLLMIVAIVMMLSWATGINGQTDTRHVINIPDIPGYLTLKCDFHMHTVFSDGLVWPTVRAEEIWREGLDAFSITDHIEYTPFEDDLPINYNRSYEIVVNRANELGLIVMKGAEITRELPPGHFNCLFLDDINPLDTPEFIDAIEAAHKQNAFIFWNHPGWGQPDGKEKWYDIHTELSTKKMLGGIEVVNGTTYYPVAHRWALEKKLTMLGNSDLHAPATMDYDLARGEHRPMTLVFAKEKTTAGIKEALEAGRTVVYHGEHLIGVETYLAALFANSVTVLNPEITIVGNQSTPIFIKNSSDIPYRLGANGTVPEIAMPASLVLYAGTIVQFNIKATSETTRGKKELVLPYIVENLLVEPGRGLAVDIKILATFKGVE